MIVKLGNATPLGEGMDHGDPCVTTFAIPEEYTHAPGANAIVLMRHLVANPDVTHLPDNEAFLVVVKSWNSHSSGAPTWVASDDADMQRLLGEYWQIPTGEPADVEATHYTVNGPPGVGPEPEVVQ